MPIDGDYTIGTKIFMQSCSGCHSLDMNTQKKKTTGPALG